MHFQGYFGIFRDIDAYSATLTCVQLGRKGETSPMCFENRKKCPDFRKKSSPYDHLWVKFSIQNIILRVSRRKNSKMFPWGLFFLCFWRNVYRIALVPQNFCLFAKGFILIFFLKKKLGFTARKAEPPLQVMELQEKET